ncbi:MAG: fatty acid desaturase [Pseudomonadota bacterium]
MPERVDIEEVNAPDHHAVPDHRMVIAALGPDVRAHLVTRSDAPGLIKLALHAAAISLTSTWIMVGWPGWPLALFAQGVLLVFLFTLLHEVTHETAFRTKWINQAVASVTGALLLIPPTWFRAFHFAHHRHTNDPLRDPERSGREIDSRGALAWHLTGLPLWWSQLRILAALGRGDVSAEYIPNRARHKTVREAQIYLLGYAGLALAALASTAVADAVVWLWLVPVLLGQPVLRAYLLAEHGLCPPVANMLENSRTTLTNRVVRWLAWNMPFHAEHHAYPSVPWHRLPDFHEITRDHLASTSDGYIAFHREMAGEIKLNAQISSAR